MSDTTPKLQLPDAQMLGSDVLILSSDRGFINHHREVLLSIGFVPVTATTVDAAIAVMRWMVIELVIVDEQIGVAETQNVLDYSRGDVRSIPVLVVGQASDVELRRRALELGAANYLDRPAFQDDVVRALLAHCSRRGNPLWGPQLN